MREDELLPADFTKILDVSLQQRMWHTYGSIIDDREVRVGGKIKNDFLFSVTTSLHRISILVFILI